MNVCIRVQSGTPRGECFEQLWPLPAIPTVGSEIRVKEKGQVYHLWVREVIWDLTFDANPLVFVYASPHKPI